MEPLTGELAAKIGEQIERSVHLIGFVPEENLAWVPPIGGAWSFGQLLGHMLDCMAGFCAVLYAAHPERLAHFTELQSLPVNNNCHPWEALERIDRYQSYLDEGFTALLDCDLGRRLTTVFVPQGETVLTLLLGNLEHLINHKHQLFMYLKLAGIDVRTPDLYQFRS
jgi:uncharacterized damage-inducible protein DinB